ncbi:MAG: DUF4190 domain-containing protein [Pyrinomonadaceae bacterium]
MNPSDAAFCLNCSASLALAGGGRPYQQPNAPYVGGQAPYVGAPPQQYVAAQSGAPGGASQRAIIALVLAIVGLLCCGPLTGVPAAIVGWLELDAIKSGKSPEAGKLLAQIGLWGGIAVTLLHSAIWVIYLLFAMMASAM